MIQITGVKHLKKCLNKLNKTNCLNNNNNNDVSMINSICCFSLLTSSFTSDKKKKKKNTTTNYKNSKAFTRLSSSHRGEALYERASLSLHHSSSDLFQYKQFKMPNSDSNFNTLSESKQLLLSLLTILIYYFFSISLTFYNRYLFVTYKYPLSITVIHLIFKFLVSALLRSLLDASVRWKRCSLSKSKRITLDWSTYLKKVVPTGIASAADIGFSNWSLQYITVTLYTMSKSTVILFILMFSLLFKLEKWRRSLIVVVLCIATGLFLFTYHSTQFHLFGFLLVMFASFTSGLRWTLAQTVTQKHELGLSNPIDMIYHIQPGMILCLLPLAVYVESLDILSTEKFFRTNDIFSVLHNFVWILIGACIAFLLEASELLVVTFTSSLTLSVSGIFKEICIVYLAVVWNNNQLNKMNTAGLVICLIGISIHVVIRAKHATEISLDKDNTRKVTRNRNFSSTSVFEEPPSPSPKPSTSHSPQSPAYLNSTKQIRRSGSISGSASEINSKFSVNSVKTLITKKSSKNMRNLSESFKLQQQEPLLNDKYDENDDSK